jgi:alpha-ketoglutarate-dependent taurine dioxygenase
MEFTTTVQLSGGDPEASAATALAPVGQHEVTVMRIHNPPGDLRHYFDRFVESLGTPVEIAEDYATGGKPTGERWAEICYRSDVPDDVAFRHSKNAQPLHTDESYVSSPAGIMLFYCVNAAPTGGETTFVSGHRLVEFLRSHDPALLDRLLSTKVRYSKAGDFKYRPILEMASDGTVDLNFNYYCADPDQEADALDLNQRFFDLLQTGLPDEMVLPVRLGRGDAVAWHDKLVLHGRNAFSATKTGDRLIWKTGIVLAA